MTRRNLISLASLLLLSASSTIKMGLAQETPKPAAEAKSAAQANPRGVYRLEFVVRELEDGKRVNSRSYTVSVRGDDDGRLRVGSRVPIQTGDKSFQYEDVGINIDCHLTQQEDGVLLGMTFESSSVVGPEKMSASAASPIFRQVRFSGQASVRLGKPTVIATLDDVATNHRYEVEVTATKVG